MSLMPAAYLVSFVKGFKVGYRKPEPLPPAMTMLRAIASIAAMVRDAQLLDSVLSGQVVVSVMLPLARCCNHIKPLVPANLSIITRISELIAERTGVSLQRKAKCYLTLSAAAALVRAFNASARGQLVPGIIAERLTGEVGVKSTRRGEAVLYEQSEATHFDGDIEVVAPKQVSEHRNAVDRLTGVARPFVVTYMSVSNMMLLVDAPVQLDGQLDRALRLLGEVGVGGLRSRGLGRFTIERVRLPPEDERILGNVVPLSRARCGRYALVLGELPLSSNTLDWESSFFEVYVVAGYTGPPYAQALYGPLVVTHAGAIVRVGECNGSPGVGRIELGSGIIPSTFIFNPLVIVGE